MAAYSLSNREAVKVTRIVVPMVDQDNDTYPPPSPTPGFKYFLPDRPDIDKRIVVGIEAHLSQQNLVIPSAGDLSDTYNNNGINIIPVNLSTFVFLTIYGHDKTEKLKDMPINSLYPFVSYVGPSLTPGWKKMIKPIIGRINTRLSYCYIPANVGVIGQQFILSLTFYTI